MHDVICENTWLSAAISNVAMEAVIFILGLWVAKKTIMDESEACVSQKTTTKKVTPGMSINLSGNMLFSGSHCRLEETETS